MKIFSLLEAVKLIRSMLPIDLKEAKELAESKYLYVPNSLYGVNYTAEADSGYPSAKLSRCIPEDALIVAIRNHPLFGQHKEPTPLTDLNKAVIAKEWISKYPKDSIQIALD